MASAVIFSFCREKTGHTARGRRVCGGKQHGRFAQQYPLPGDRQGQQYQSDRLGYHAGSARFCIVRRNRSGWTLQPHRLCFAGTPSGSGRSRCLYGTGNFRSARRSFINECSDVSAAASAVAEGSNEIGTVYYSTIKSLRKTSPFWRRTTARWPVKFCIPSVGFKARKKNPMKHKRLLRMHSLLICSRKKHRRCMKAMDLISMYPNGGQTCSN